MQTTIVIEHAQTDCSGERFDCRVAAMSRVMALLDAGVAFSVDYHHHDITDALPVRRVTLWDEMAVRPAGMSARDYLDGWRVIDTSTN